MPGLRPSPLDHFSADLVELILSFNTNEGTRKISPEAFSEAVINADRSSLPTFTSA
jgi:hypothetical protein